MQKIRIRASSADLAWACPESQVQVTSEGKAIPHIDHDNDAAALGTAVHTMMTSYCDPTVHELPQPEHVLDAMGLPDVMDDFQFLFAAAVRLWDENSDDFPNPAVEVDMAREGERVTLVGRADVLASIPPVLRIGDHKTGRITEGKHHQMRAYAAMGLAYAFDCDQVDLRLFWAREHRTEPVSLSRWEVDQWFAEFEQRQVDGQGVFKPGPWCDGCRRRHSCPGRREWIDGAIVNIAAGGIPLLSEADAKDIAIAVTTWHEQKKAITSLLEEQTSRLREWITENGPLPMEGDRVLDLQPVAKRTIHPKQAWGLVLDALENDYDALAQTVKFSNERLKKEVMGKAKRGAKTAVWNALIATMKTSGAMTEEPGTPRMTPRARKDSDDGTGLGLARREGGATGTGEEARGDDRALHQPDAGGVAGE